MATTEEQDVPPATHTVGGRIGEVWEEVIDVPAKVQDIVYASRGRTLWPLLLIGVVMTALWVRKPAATVLGALALVLLAVWASAREKSR